MSSPNIGVQCQKTFLQFSPSVRGGVMALATIIGAAIPLLRARFGKDAAVGSSVLITACADSDGFFIFVGSQLYFSFRPKRPDFCPDPLLYCK